MSDDWLGGWGLEGARLEDARTPRDEVRELAVAGERVRFVESDGDEEDLAALETELDFLIRGIWSHS